MCKLNKVKILHITFLSDVYVLGNIYCFEKPFNKNVRLPHF